MSYPRSGYWGKPNWGAGYGLTASSRAAPYSYGPTPWFSTNLGLDTYAQLDGKYARLAAVTATGTAYSRSSSSLGFNAYVGTANVYSKTFGSQSSAFVPASVTAVDWKKTFWSQNVNLVLGFIPVTFKVQATGRIKFELSGRLNYSTLEVTAKPSADASLYLSAAIGGQYCKFNACIGARAGVYSTVTLVKASAPMTASGTLHHMLGGGVKLNWGAQVDAVIQSLDGEAGVFADACLGGCIHEEKTLIEFDGYEVEYPIANTSGSVCLTTSCSSTGID